MSTLVPAHPDYLTTGEAARLLGFRRVPRRDLERFQVHYHLPTPEAQP